MELEHHRMNPLSLKDWQDCFHNTDKNRVWGVLKVVSWGMGVGGAIACIWAFGGHAAALPEEVANSLSYGIFVMFAMLGAMAACWMAATALLHALAAVWLMATLRQATPVVTLAGVPGITDFLEQENEGEESEHGTGDAVSLR